MEPSPPGVRLLGRPAVIAAGRELVLGADRPAQLAGYLAHADDWVERERVAGVFWGDADEATARQNLRQTIARLRALDLAPPPEVERRRLRWRIDSDLARLRSALAEGREDAAARLYTGPLLDGLEGYAGDGFADWLESERAALHARVRSAVLRLAAGALAETVTPAAGTLGDAGMGATASADQALERLLTLDPLDEELLAARMEMLGRSGRAAAALIEYRSFETRLRRELALEPSFELRSLARRLAGAQQAGPVRPLPEHGTTFVGRDVELAQVVERFAAGARLVTLVGHSGIGKTRLAREAARELVPGHAQGAAFVPLSEVRSVDALPSAVAAAIGVTLDPTVPALDALVDALASRGVLLVLDNLEHLDVAPVVARLLTAAPRLAVLATSHRRLGLAHEWVVPLDGLAVPAVGAELGAIERHDSVRLFIDRAKRADPGFDPVPDDIRAVAELCRLVGGSPLAIELAAALVRAMSPSELASDVAAALDLLESDATDLPPRHRSVRAALDHSWSALPEGSRARLARLAVFRGGFGHGAARAVAGTHPAELAAFVDAALVRRNDSRFDLHPLVRAYLEEALGALPGEPEVTARRHAHTLLALVERPEARLPGRPHVAWLEDVAADRDNLSAALAFAVDHADVDLGLRLVGPLQRFWLATGSVVEGHRWCDAVLALAGADRPTEALARALNTLGSLQLTAADVAGAEASFERSAAVARAIGSAQGVARTAIGAGLAAARRGETALARERYVEGLALQRQLGNVEAVIGLLNNLGVLALEEARSEEAARWLADGLAAARSVRDDHMAATFLANLGWAERLRGDLPAARRTLEDALAAARELDLAAVVGNTLGNLAAVELELGETLAADRHSLECLDLRIAADDRWGLAYTLECRANVAAALGDVERCAVLSGAAEALRARLGTPRPAGWEEPTATYAARAREALGDEAFEAALTRGRGLSLVEAVALASGACVAEAVAAPASGPPG